MYADDTIHLIKDIKADGVDVTTSNSLNKAMKYGRNNDLAVNPLKTLQVIFSKRKDNTPNISDVPTDNRNKFLSLPGWRYNKLCSTSTLYSTF